MYVLRVGEGWFTTNQALKAGNNLATVVQGGVSDGGSVDCEKSTVDEGVTGRQAGEHGLDEAQSKIRGEEHTKRENRPCRRPHRIRSCC